MKLLLDENVPRQLKQELTNHEVFTVKEKGWNGKRNGKLLKLMTEEQFDVLITADKNLQHQRNFQKYPIPVLVLNAFRVTYENILPLVPQLRVLLSKSLPGGPTILQG